MRPRSPLGAVRLAYDFRPERQSGAAVDHPLFAVLSAVQEHGSVAHAARALGRSYRHVWGLLREAEAALGESLIAWQQGQKARLTDFAQRLVWAERRARTRVQAQLEALRDELENVVAEARDANQVLLTICASHDLALPRLREHALTHTSLHLELRTQGSLDAVRSLNAGRCLMAGFHVPRLAGAAPVFARALKPLLKPGVHKLIACSRRTQGLMLRREHAAAVRGLADVPGQGLRLVNRQVGSGTRLLMDHLLERATLRPAQLPGYDSRIEESHVAVAACVASGVADVGPGVETAALEFGLHFLPLIEEDYFLVCLKPALEHPAVRRLQAVLTGEAWSRLLETLPGYQLPPQAGAVLSMTSALPWWRYASPRGGVATRAQHADASLPTD